MRTTGYYDIRTKNGWQVAKYSTVYGWEIPRGLLVIEVIEYNEIKPIKEIKLCDHS